MLSNVILLAVWRWRTLECPVKRLVAGSDCKLHRLHKLFISFLLFKRSKMINLNQGKFGKLLVSKKFFFSSKEHYVEYSRTGKVIKGRPNYYIIIYTHTGLVFRNRCPTNRFVSLLNVWKQSDPQNSITGVM